MNSPLIDHLNAQLATAWVLALNAKRYHWTVTGPHFRDYHLRFDEVYAAAEGTVDELGERIRMLGGTPIFSPGQIETHSVVKPSDPHAKLEPLEMIHEALEGEGRVITFLHDGIELASSVGDPGTADLLTRFVQVHQKEAWFLRAIEE